MVKNHWAQNPLSHDHSEVEGFCQKLLQLKKLNIKWAKDKQRKENKILSSLEADIASITNENNRGFMNLEDKAHFIDLENKRANILKEWGETWRLKSPAILLKEGDDNAKYFQSFTKGRKATNTIWKLPTSEGGSTHTFHQLSQLGITHFQ